MHTCSFTCFCIKHAKLFFSPEDTNEKTYILHWNRLLRWLIPFSLRNRSNRLRRIWNVYGRSTGIYPTFVCIAILPLVYIWNSGIRASSLHSHSVITRFTKSKVVISSLVCCRCALRLGTWPFPVNLPLRIIVYSIGVIVCSLAIALLFSTYLSPEAYEMCVKEFAFKFKKPMHKVKTVYDCTSLVVAILLCIILFNPFKADGILGVFNNFMSCGIGIGTVACALLYGVIIGLFQKLYSKIFIFKDAFKLRKYFEESEKK